MTAPTRGGHRADVTCETTGGNLIPATLAYDTTDPYTVQVTFVAANHGEDAVWPTDRMLLAHGLKFPAHADDMSVVPLMKSGLIAVTLRPPSGGGVTVLFERSDMTQFLSRVFRLVPRGDEARFADWDTALSLLGGAR